MATHLCRSARRASCCLAAVLLPLTASWAHVALDSPNGGETLDIGSTFTIRWHPSIQHDTVNWDLWYSTEGSNGPWEVISLDLPLGNPSAGSPHSYQWLVGPDLGNANAWVRVRQDNTDQDYFDVSDSSFFVAVPLLAGDFNEDGRVNSDDLVNWEAGYGISTEAFHANGDADEDDDVDGEDFLQWQRQAEGSASFSAARPVPEPATLLLFALSCVAARWSADR